MRSQQASTTSAHTPASVAPTNPEPLHLPQSTLAFLLRAQVMLTQVVAHSLHYVRMLKSPGLYCVGVDYQEDDNGLIQKRADIAHSAAVLLEKCHLIKYERASGRFQSTELGRIASHYYVTYNSMATYNQHLRPTMSTLELFRVFALSNEFKLLPVRQEEKLELGKLLERVPIPVKEGVDEPAAKINVLLQAYISQLKLDGSEDGQYQRVHVSTYVRWLSDEWWGSMTPLRQFKGVSQEVIRKAEGKQFPWYRYFDLDPPEIGELIGIPNAGRLVHRLVHSFPKLQLQAQVQPITRSLLRIDLSIVPDFRWDKKTHGTAETFLIMVEDVDGEIILFHDSFVLRQRYAEDEHNVTITVPMFEPVPPNYYISVVSDRWLHAETRPPISFKHLILSEKFPPPTPLLELQPLPLSALHNKEFESIYSSTIQTFNKIQTQVFQALYTSDENVFIGAPTGSGKTICAEFTLLRLWSKREQPRAFSGLQGGKEIVSLTGDTSADLRLLEKGDVVCTPSQWDTLSRRWRQRKNVQNIGLLIADEIQLVGGEVGPTYEVVISRTRYVSAQTEIKTRIVACGVSLANIARDLGEWMGAPSHAIFNFSPSSRSLDMDIHLQSFTIPHFPSLMIAMSKPAYLAIVEHSPTKVSLLESHQIVLIHPHSSAHPGGTFLARLFHRSPSDTHDTSPSSPLDWARNLLRPHGQSSEGTELQGRSPTVVEVPYAQGKRRNACAREKRKRLLSPWKNPTASSSQPPKPNTTQQSGTATRNQPSLQPQPAVSNSSTTPAVGANTAAASSIPSHPGVILRQAGLWTRFWLFIGCLSPEYQDGRH
ncbi:Sec63 Brl domain-containing protein [Suillus subluteus]|nr:Sec63 Brl domain-containing protein [Suillus subluteus]